MQVLRIAVAFGLALVASAEPLPQNVSTWEGVFERSHEEIVIRIEDLPPLHAVLYRLAGGSRGTAIGFSTSSGEALFRPLLHDKGVQPVFREYFVSFSPGGIAEVSLVFVVQGNGGLTAVETYAFDGAQVSLSSRTMHGGRHDPKWHGEDGAQSIDARAQGLDALRSERDVLEAKLTIASGILEAEGWYLVRPGDTLSALAHDWGVSVSAIEKINPHIHPPRLRVSLWIRKPAKAEPGAQTTSGSPAED